jgi:hypothetical protein
MAEEGKGIALVILGIVAIIAVVGLVLLFTRGSSEGLVTNSLAAPSASDGYNYACYKPCQEKEYSNYDEFIACIETCHYCPPEEKKSDACCHAESREKYLQCIKKGGSEQQCEDKKDSHLDSCLNCPPGEEKSERCCYAKCREKYRECIKKGGTKKQCDDDATTCKYLCRPTPTPTNTPSPAAPVKTITPTPIATTTPAPIETAAPTPTVTASPGSR